MDLQFFTNNEQVAEASFDCKLACIYVVGFSYV